MPKKKTAQQIVQDKAERVLLGVATWVSFYRDNPHRFAKDFLNINLKLFQKILLYAMMHNNYFLYLAARGQGKTFLIALFATIRCILFPGTKIVVTAGVKSQATEVLLKIKDDFCKLHGWGSSNLNNEISEIKISTNDAEINFKNGSWIKVKTSNDNARSARANILIVDEFRMVDKSVIDTVLRRFLTAPRNPGYLNKQEYKHLIERNKELYASSCWYTSHWSFDKVKAYFTNMMAGKKYFICSIPYQVSILEGLLDRGQIEDEMSESDFDMTTFIMEMLALFYGDNNGNFFTYNEIAKRRKVKVPLYPLELYMSKDINIPKLSNGEERILSVDVALMSSKKNSNDAAALIINRAIPTSDVEYMSNIVYIDTKEGLTTDELGLEIMRTYYEFKCTQLVIDTNGLGIGVADFVMKDQYDPHTGKTYKAFTCCNDETMAMRCKVKDANKVFWSVKANANFNNDMAVLLRTGFQNNRINLLVHELEGEEELRTKLVKGWSKCTPREQALYKNPFIQTSLMINELVNLESYTKNGVIKIYEKRGMRKDRYSSLGYNYWVLNQIMISKKPKQETNDLVDKLAKQIRKSSRKFGMMN